MIYPVLRMKKDIQELETTYQDIQSKIRDIQKVNEWFASTCHRR